MSEGTLRAVGSVDRYVGNVLREAASGVRGSKAASAAINNAVAKLIREATGNDNRSGMDILKDILKDQRGFAKPPSGAALRALLSSVSSAALVMAALASLLDMMRHWAMSGIPKHRPGSYSIDHGDWIYLHTVGECKLDHPDETLYYPAPETARMAAYDIAYPPGDHHVFPPLYNTGYHAVWVKSYCYQLGGQPAYPPLDEDAREVFVEPDVWERPATVTPMQPGVIVLPVDDQQDYYWPARWLNPWPHLDPLGDPRSVPGGAPLNLPEKTPIPVRVLPYRVTNPLRSPHEQTQWGPRPAWPIAERSPWEELLLPDVAPASGGHGVGLVPGGIGFPEPPRAREREGKYSGPKVFGVPLTRVKEVVAKAFSNLTEASDFVDCAYSAVPSGSRIPYRPGNPITVDEKAAVAFKAMQSGNIDGGAFAQCVVTNHVKDALLGAMHRRASKQLPRGSALPGGYWMPSSFGVR